ncbi:T9SS type A sorting domain-containing protein [Flavobacterium sp.]|uniref:T9SS type A sorting domain-containing protein n=1 Tax=Flavobacterium sp. TaxID=239 RepID=UPI0040484E50
MKAKLFFILILLKGPFSYGQFNVTENFESSTIIPPSWDSQNFGLFTSSESCSGTNSAKATIYGSSSIASITTPSYTSDGNQINVAIKYKAILASSFNGLVTVSYEINNSNSWVPLFQDNFIDSQCRDLRGYIGPDVVASGTTVRFRFTAVRSSGQADIIFDDFTAIQETPALISEYTFDGTRNNSLGTLPFSSTNNNYTTDRNGQINSALLTSSSATAPISNLPLGNAPRTISLWFFNNISGATKNIFKYGGNATNQTFGCYLLNGRVYFQGNGNDTNTNFIASTGVFSHLVVTYNGTIVKMYINGTQIGTNITFPANTFNSLFTIGHSSSNIGYDDLKIFNGALKQTDINSLYTNNTLSSSDFNQNNLKVAMYPNPVNDILNIDIENEIKSVEIYNIQGQRVIQSNSKQIETSSLNSGIYMVRIEDTNGGIATQKLIKK